MSELDVLVVGGGVSGLATAHCLAHSGLAVEVWEGAARPGGKIRTELKDGYRLESAASMVVNFRSELDPFLRTAGLEASRRARSPMAQRYVLDAGRLVEAPSGPGDMLRTPILSTAGKLRLLAEPLAPRGRDPHESVADFVTRRMGREFLEKLFEPYVAGPLASDADLAEARATLPRLTALERRYGSLALGALIRKAWRGGSASRPDAFSFSGGMQTLVETLASQGGFRVRGKLRASEVWPVQGGWMTRGVGGDGVRASFSRQLVLCTPADAAAGLVRCLDSELARLLGAIEYAPVNVVHTGFDLAKIGHPLNGSGFLLPRRSGFSPNGCLWISRLFPDHAPQGRVLMSSYLGGARNRAAADWDATRSLDAVMHMLGVLLGIRAEPDLFHIESHSRALPLYHGAYSLRMAGIERRLASLPGLYLEANYKGGVSVRDRIRCAELAASRILRHRDSLALRHSARVPASGDVQNMVPASAAVR